MKNEARMRKDVRRQLQEQYRINYLYYLVHVDNMLSIHRRGLLSHNVAHGRGFVTTDIADQDVVGRRAVKEVFGKPLHDYVPTYFTPKNPMLFRRREIQDDIVILCLDRDLLLQDGTIFSDGNAASGGTSFFNDLRFIGKLDFDCIRAERWSDFEDGRRKRCAEVLVPDGIPFDKIEQIVLRTEVTRPRLPDALQTRKNVLVDSRWYFDG